jgi:flagellar hook-associated protein 3 FlgL
LTGLTRGSTPQSGSGGFADTVYRGGNSGNNNIAVAADRTVGTNLTANSADLRTTLKGMAIMTYVAEAGAGLDSATVRELFNAAGTEACRVPPSDFTNARAMLGMQEAAVAQADNP